MRRIAPFFVVLVLFQCTSKSGPSGDTAAIDSTAFPREMVAFIEGDRNPVFAGTGSETWDRNIRERGFILKEDSGYSLWYTGYGSDGNEEKHLGYATSTDGITWQRYPGNPIYSAGWVEDMIVVPFEGSYIMFAEGRNDVAHWLTSTDRIHWTEHGPLNIRKVNGDSISPGPYGTPTVWLEDGVWSLFYERNDSGVWLAQSKDHIQWTHVSDEPVLVMGPDKVDRHGVAMDQIVKYQGRYFAFYHATEFSDWHEWSSCVAMSDDLIHWVKYPGNPIQGDNKSSPILVHDGAQYRLYTMHPDVRVHFPAADN